jgi:hypothetical protein
MEKLLKYGILVGRYREKLSLVKVIFGDAVLGSISKFTGTNGYI